MISLITQNLAEKKSLPETTGGIVGGLAGIGSAAAFSVVAGVGVALAPAGVPPILTTVGMAGVALSPTIGFVAGKVAEAAAKSIMN